MGEARIVQDPAILVGKPTVRGTRISVEFVLERLAAGEGFEEILAAFPRLTTEDILACLDYARAILAREIEPQPWPAYSLPG
jgi:uncharacterized protein (DUF433 family)